MHGGRIGCVSKLGEGSEFFFEMDLPIAGNGALALVPASESKVESQDEKDRLFVPEILTRRQPAHLLATPSATPSHEHFRGNGSRSDSIRGSPAERSQLDAADVHDTFTIGPAATNSESSVRRTTEIAVRSDLNSLSKPASKSTLSSTKSFDGAHTSAVVSELASREVSGESGAIELKELGRPVHDGAGTVNHDRPVHRPALRILRVLLAEDHMPTSKLMAKMLTQAGCEVTAVENGAAAVDKATTLPPASAGADMKRDCPFDVIFMDGTMPLLGRSDSAITCPSIFCSHA